MKKESEITAGEVADLKERLSEVEVQMDGQTFQPYKELDGRRYYIEAMMDEEAIGKK